MKKIEYKNAFLSYSDIGTGKTVVLLHGFLENSKMWQEFLPSWSKENRVISIDLLGHGATTSIGYIHTMEDMADAVFYILHQLKIKEAVIMGHSMGGYVALAFAELYPRYINGLVLLNSTSRADTEERKMNRTRAILAVKQNYRAAISMAIANLFSEQNRSLLVKEIEWAKTEALQTPLQGIIAAQEGMKDRKDREILIHTASYPKLLILGKKDTVLNYEENKDQVEGTNMQLVTFNDGHMSHFENKEALKEVILKFLKNI